MFSVGTVLAGKYRVDRVLGQGGMGVVVGATHLHLHQPVALKFLLPEMVQNPQVVERFVREARASAQLRSEHVCRVSDVGAFDNGAPYIVMELLNGSDLSSQLVSNGPLPVSLAADYVLQACMGIAEAHALGIVHRDLKPANLFLTRRPDGTPLIKVLDFGIAKAQSDQNFSLTQTSAVMGSPGYMSPEQLRSSRDVDVRSDIWSIGVILYELVCGRPPFVANSITELALHIAMDPTPPLIGMMPPGFELVVQRCLAKEPAQRYPDLANFAHDLAAYAGPSGIELAAAVSRLLNVVPSAASSIGMHRATPASGVRTSAIGSHTAPTTMGSAVSSMVTSHHGGARRWPLVAGLLVAMAAAVGVTVVAMRGGDRGNAAVSSPPAASATPSGTPSTAPAAAPTIDAAQPAPVDAADVLPPAPAPVVPPVSPTPPAQPPVDAGVVDAPRKLNKPSKPKPRSKSDEDLGESRY